jgi:phospholipase C
LRSFIWRWVRLVIAQKRFVALALGVLLATSFAYYATSAQQEAGEGSAGRAVSGPSVLETQTGNASPSATATLDDARNKIQHVVVIMQENRSFDNYFGTYPGADGLPRTEDGEFTVCVPNPRTGGCDEPYHESEQVNSGGSHSPAAGLGDINGGKMDGFIAIAESYDRGCGAKYATGFCAPSTPPDVMGFHDAREIPNYWTYAQQFVLQDHMFGSTLSWSLPAHLFTVSGWSARCPFGKGEPSSCHNDNDLANYKGFGPLMVGKGAPLSMPPPMQRCIGRYGVQLGDTGQPSPDDPALASALQQCIDFAWTDLTYLLYNNNISWRYYVTEGTEPDCADDAAECPPVAQDADTPGIWNPLPYFETVKQDHQLDNIQDVSNFYEAAKNGTLPAVSWVVPGALESEHAPASISDGQAHVTSLINAIMQGPNWESTAIFLSWDEWGGFYDHVKPPKVDENGYGIRVPGLVISPYAKQGYIDHQTLSFDAYLKFMEDLFLGGQRIDPETDGRPDPRPTVRENVPQLGDLLEDFDFSQPPRSPVVLSPYPSGPQQANLPYTGGSLANIVYLVQPGDTLSEIAERFSTSVEAIARANDIENPNLIFVDQVLYVPASSMP